MDRRLFILLAALATSGCPQDLNRTPADSGLVGRDQATARDTDEHDGLYLVRIS